MRKLATLLALLALCALSPRADALFLSITPPVVNVNAVSGAATLNADGGTVTSESLVTAAGATYTLTLANNQVTAASIVMATLANGSNNAGDPTVTRVTPTFGQVVIIVTNRHATNALNGTLKISFLVAN